MKYRLLKNDCVLTNKLFYDKGVADCAGKDIRVYLSRVKDPLVVTTLKYRYMEDEGYFNVHLEDGTSVFSVSISRLLIERKD